MTQEEFRIAFSVAVAEDDKPLCEPAEDDVCELTNAGLDNLVNIAEATAEPLFDRIKELADALDKAERMITYMACVFYRKDLQDYFPYGMADEVKAYVKDSGKTEDLIRAARNGHSAQSAPLVIPDWTNGFPFESDDYEREFYCGTVLDGWQGGDTTEKFTVLNDAINRASERSTDGDVWGVYQVGKTWDDDDGYRSDRIVALVFKQNPYLFEPEPKECKERAEAAQWKS